MPIRSRDHLLGRAAAWIAPVGGGVVANLLSLHPTDSRPVDTLLLFICAAAVTWASASTPWWLVASAAGIAAALAESPLLWVGVGGAVLAAVPTPDRHAAALNQVSTIAALVAFAGGRHIGFQGLGALVACTILSIVAVAGIRRRPRVVRRRAIPIIAGVAVAAVVGVALLGLSAWSARTPLREGEAHTRDAIDELNDGDLAAAATAFQSASEAFGRARRTLDGPLGLLSRAVPVVAQNRSAVGRLTAGAEHATGVAANALRRIDPESIRVVNGRIDVAAIAALDEPFRDLSEALVDLRADVEGTGSSWLLPQLTRRLAPLAEDLDRNNVDLARARHAIDVAPGLLGADGERRYFIVFTTPAEARALGGFMGNWAEMTITDGEIEMTDFGRTDELNLGGPDPEARDLTIPDEFVDRWTADLLDGDGSTNRVTWLNITKPPDFPTVAEMITELYPQSGGRPVDGVILLDVEAVAALLEFTGPVEVEGAPDVLTAENTAQFLLEDQYVLQASGERIDLLERIARETVTRLLTTALPPPAELASVLAPAAREGRLLAWSPQPEEEQLFEQVGIAGSFPRLEGKDGFAVTVDNEAGNKLDAYLRVEGTYSPAFDPATGAATGRLTIRLHNDAPSEGLSDYAIGNFLDLPNGTNRMRLSVFTALPIASVYVDGEQAGMEFDEFFGWNVGMRYITIPSRGTSEVVVDLAGVIDAGPHEITTWTQPLANDPEFEVRAADAVVIGR